MPLVTSSAVRVDPVSAVGQTAAVPTSSGCSVTETATSSASAVVPPAVPLPLVLFRPGPLVSASVTIAPGGDHTIPPTSEPVVSLSGSSFVFMPLPTGLTFCHIGHIRIG